MERLQRGNKEKVSQTMQGEIPPVAPDWLLVRLKLHRQRTQTLFYFLFFLPFLRLLFFDFGLLLFHLMEDQSGFYFGMANRWELNQPHLLFRNNKTKQNNGAIGLIWNYPVFKFVPGFYLTLSGYFLTLNVILYYLLLLWVLKPAAGFISDLYVNMALLPSEPTRVLSLHRLRLSPLIY